MAEKRFKTLTLVSLGLSYPDVNRLKMLEESDQYPRVTTFREALNTDEADERFLERAPRWRRKLYKLLPTTVALVLEAFIVKRKYDAVISWAEKPGLLFALLLKITGSRVPHIALFGWPAKGAKAFLLRHTHKQFDRIIMWSTVQRDKVINELGVPREKILFIKWFVDQKFFRPMPRETDMICSVGSEMRDYPTFLKAIDGLDIKCHVAAGTTIERQSLWVRAVETEKNLPSNVTVGKKSALELRELYARSRFVVIPLHQTETDNGITTMLEAFAMGKPVICSRTIGQVDVIEEGKTGIFVPVGDSRAMREAIERLWNLPEEAKRMGKEARKYVEQHATMDGFICIVRTVVEQTIAEYGQKQI